MAKRTESSAGTKEARYALMYLLRRRVLFSEFILKKG